MTNVEKVASDFTDQLEEYVKRSKDSHTIADILRDKSILESEILNKVCEFEEKHKEVEVVNIELEAYTASSVGISGVEYIRNTNVKIKISLKQ